MIATYKKVRMDTLFPIDPGYPQGFSYVRDFIDQAEEELLLKAISEIELHTFLFQGYEAKRRVASFGYDYSFDKRSLSKGKDIPVAFHWLLEKVPARRVSKPRNSLSCSLPNILWVP